MFGKKIEAKVILYNDGHAKVKADLIGAAKMYLACKRVLEREGVNVEKVNELMHAVHIKGEAGNDAE